MPDRRGKAAARSEAHDLRGAADGEAVHQTHGEHEPMLEDDAQDLEARLAAALAAQVGGGQKRVQRPGGPPAASVAPPDAPDSPQLPLELHEPPADEAPEVAQTAREPDETRPAGAPEDEHAAGMPEEEHAAAAHGSAGEPETLLSGQEIPGPGLPEPQSSERSLPERSSPERSSLEQASPGRASWERSSREAAAPAPLDAAEPEDPFARALAAELFGNPAPAARPVASAARPAVPATRPVVPTARQAEPATRPAAPIARATEPATRPAAPAARQAEPASGPARPLPRERATPATPSAGSFLRAPAAAEQLGQGTVAPAPRRESAPAREGDRPAPLASGGGWMRRPRALAPSPEESGAATAIRAPVAGPASPQEPAAPEMPASRAPAVPAAAAPHAPVSAQAGEPDIELALDAAIGEIVASRHGGQDRPRPDGPDATAAAVTGVGFAQNEASASRERQVPPGGPADSAPPPAPHGVPGEGAVPGGDAMAASEADAGRAPGLAEPVDAQHARRPRVTPFEFAKPPARSRPVPVFRFDKSLPKPEASVTAPPASPDDPFAPDPLGVPPAGTRAGTAEHRRPTLDPARLGPDALDPMSAHSVPAALHGPAADEDIEESGAHAAVEGVYDDDEAADWPETERMPPALAAAGARRPRRAFQVLAGVLGLMIAGAVGLAFYGAVTGDTRSGEPPLIRADAVDVREAPEVASAEPAATRSTAFHEAGQDAAGEERLVIPSVPDFEEEIPAGRDEPLDEDLLRSRSVRTVVVRPDGTIIRAPAANDAAAGEIAAAGRAADAAERESPSRRFATAGTRPTGQPLNPGAAASGPVAAFADPAATDGRLDPAGTDGRFDPAGTDGRLDPAGSLDPAFGDGRPAAREDEPSIERLLARAEADAPSSSATGPGGSRSLAESELAAARTDAGPADAPAAAPEFAAATGDAAATTLPAGETVAYETPPAPAGPIALPRPRPAPPVRSAAAEPAPQPAATASAPEQATAAAESPDGSAAAPELATADADSARTEPPAQVASAPPASSRPAPATIDTGVLRPNQLAPEAGGRRPAFAQWSPLAAISRTLRGSGTEGESGAVSPNSPASETDSAALASNSEAVPAPAAAPPAAAAPAADAPAANAPAAAEPEPSRPTGSTTTAEIFPWSVQVSSQRTASEAQAAYRWLQRRYPEILGGRAPIISEIDLEERGKFYRVRVPAASREEAADLCGRLTAAGAECFIGRTGNS